MTRNGSVSAAALAALILGGGDLAAHAQTKHRAKTPEPPPPAADSDALPTKPKQFPVGATWVLKNFNDKPLPVNDELTFSIDSNYRGSGYSGCNMWSATVYPVKDQKLLVGPVAVTKKQCDKEKTQFEITYLTAIHAGPTWNVEGGNLVLKGQGGNLVFQRSL